MKKGRPGTTVHVLCDPADADRLRALLRAETGTLGVRGTTLQRWPVPRTIATVEVDGHAIRIKVSPGRIKAEFDDVARAARDTGVPLRQMATRAEAAWHAQHVKGDGSDGGGGDNGAEPPDLDRDGEEGTTA
jgi:uncharacterized protein (DUF111 family)